MIKTGIEKKYNGIKAGVLYTIGNMLIKSIPFLTLPIFTRLLTTSDFGIYTTYVSYEDILSVIMGLGISGTIKVAKIDFKDSFDQYVSSIIKLTITIGIVTLGIINLIAVSIDFKNSWISIPILNILIIQSISTAIYSIISSKYIIEGSYIENITIAFMMTGINVGSSLILCNTLMKNNPANGRIVGTALGTIIVAIYIIYSQGKSYKYKYFKEANKYALKLGLPLIPHQLSISLLSQSDKIMIQSMVGNAESGIYGLAVNISLVMSVILISIDNAWTPWYYNNLKLKEYKTLEENNNLLVALFMLLTTGFMLVSPDIINIISGEEYSKCLYSLIPLTISIFLNFMYIFFVGIEYFCKKTGYISMTTIICSIFNILLNFIFINLWGYLAAAYATCLSKALLFILHYCRSRKLISEKVVSLKCLIINLFFVIITGIITMYTVNFILIRYILIFSIVILTLYYFYRKGILNRYIKFKI